MITEAVDLENKTLVDTRAAAEILGMSQVTLELWRSKHKGPAYYKIGNAVRYATEDLDEYATRIEP
jgi:predicted DNA-binding transcriptional regulator AlpA